MPFWSRILIFTMISILGACAGEQKPATPLETFQTYTKAIKKKDITTMKLLLSSGTIKMHIQNILEKLGASDRTHAVTIAIQRGILHLES